MEESFDSPIVAPSIRRVTSGRLVIVGVKEVTVPFIEAGVLESISLLVMILYPVTGVSVADDVPKISLSLSLSVLIWCP
jgi:hypothetical protein